MHSIVYERRLMIYYAVIKDNRHAIPRYQMGIMEARQTVENIKLTIFLRSTSTNFLIPIDFLVKVC